MRGWVSDSLLVYRASNIDPARNRFFFFLVLPTFFSFWSKIPLDVLLSIFLSPSSNCSRFRASCCCWKREKEFKQDNGGMKPQVLSTKIVAIPSKPQRSVIHHLGAPHNQSHTRCKNGCVATKKERWFLMRKKHEQKLSVFSVRLLYYEFMSDLNSGAKDHVAEKAGLSDPSPQD